MAVKQIFDKKITKFDIQDPNYKPELKVEEEVIGNIIEENMYGERTHTYTPEPNGNLQMEQLMTKLMGKLDGFGNRVPIGEKEIGVAPIEVDIKREIAIGKLDANAVRSEEIEGKVKNKKNKLKALRHKKMYEKQRNKK